ncbi:hypothetical protein [Haladaptatus halobius]|uniref:hypothetical protein n=1 Tax=Haladaptatus halobius TaxID=2884875 RepID=UPI001D0B9014|nr:hypothetical protein [Haladaptatus halobius]
MTREDSPKSQRRAILKATGAAAGVGLLGRIAMAQDGGGNGNQTTTTTTTTNTTETTETTNGGTETTNDGGQRTIILGGRVNYWLGLNPEVIAGAENPTLGLVPDEEYRLIWINLDGNRHAFQILGEGGDLLESTGDTAQQGATREMTFRADEDMRRYRCRYHPNSMRGDIDRSGEFRTTSGSPPRTNGTADTTETTNGGNATTGRTDTTDGTFTTDTGGTFTTGRTDTTDGTFTTETTDTTT